MVSVNTKIVSILVMMVSVTISFYVAEHITRKVFGSPNQLNGKNLRIDPNIGYKVNPNLPDVDKFGFRNESKSSSYYDLAAIGDSHTYGYNVKTHMSWPAQLSKTENINIYNFGIGGNGIYSYHYLISEALKKNKRVIIGLYIPNDFSANGYICSIDFSNNFWKTEISRLSLSPPACLPTKPQYTVSNELKLFIKQLTEKSSFLTLLMRKITGPFKNLFYQKVKLADKISPVRLSHLQSVSMATDLSSKDTNNIYKDFLAMVRDWKKDAYEGQLGVMLIPSSQAIVHRMIEREEVSVSDETAILLRDYTRNEIELEKKLLDEISSIGIHVNSATEEIINSYQIYLESDAPEQFYPDGHPGIHGYAAYARVARDILYSMALSDNTLKLNVDN